MGFLKRIELHESVSRGGILKSVEGVFTEWCRKPEDLTKIVKVL
jgi:hypothetical protein